MNCTSIFSISGNVLAMFLLGLFNQLMAQNWLPVGCGFGGPIRILETFPNDTNLYILGQFEYDECDSTSIRGICVWDGQKCATINPDASTMQTFTFTQYDEEYYAGGMFFINGQLYNFVRFRNNKWEPVTKNYGSNIYPFHFHPTDSCLYFTGGIAPMNFTYPFGFGYLKNDSLHYFVTSDQYVWQKLRCLEWYNNKLIIGGELNYEQTGTYGIGIVDIPNNQILPLEPTINVVNSNATCMKIWKGKLYIGGSFVIPPFTQVASAMLVYDGISTSIVGSHPVIGIVLDMYADSNYLYIVGAFNWVDGQLANGIARWDGNTWEVIEAPQQMPNQCYLTSIEVYKDTLYVGGSFSSNDNQLKHLAKYSIPHSTLSEKVKTPKKSNLALSPNPCTTALTVSSVETPFQFQFYNLHGQEVISGTSNAKQLDVTALRPGMYFLKVKDRTGTRTGKVVKVEP